MAMDSMDNNTSSLSLVLMATAEADLSVVLLVLLGAYFAFKGVFDSKGVSDMGKLVYHISLPCLLFSKILYEFSIERMKLLWVLMFACVAHVLSAYVIAEISGRLLWIGKMERKVATASMMFGNVGALAIAVVDSLCHSKTLVDLTGSQQECSSIGISYIAFYLITQNILMFSWGESLMFVKEKGEGEGEGEENEEEESHIVTEVSNVMTEVSENEERKLLNESFMDGRRDVLCRISTSARREVSPMMPFAASASVEQPLHHKPSWYSIRLGSKGLQKVQSHYALEADHCFGKPASSLAPDSPTSSLRSAVERYTTYMESQRELDFSGEEKALLQKLPTYISKKYFHYGGKTKAACARLKSFFSKVLEKTTQVLLRLIKTPALQASLAAVILASFPSLKELFIISSPGEGSQPPLYFVYDAVSTLGKAQVPVSMIMLSGTATLRFMTNLRKQAVHAIHGEETGTDDPKRTKVFSWKTTGLILTGRTIIMPFVGLGWWWVINTFHWIPDIKGHTPLLNLIILLESAVPTAQNVVMLLLVHGRMEKGEALAQIVLLQMAISIITFTVSCSFFQWLVIPTV